MKDPVGRRLPASLLTALRLTSDLERAARGTHRERATVAATGMLLLAANDAGWFQHELGDVIGRNQQTVQMRISAARRRLNGHAPGLQIEPPAERLRPIPPLACKHIPVQQRQWLTSREAAEHAKCSVGTIRNWLARGVLPNTNRRSPVSYFYLRADLDRVLHGPRRGAYTDYDRLQRLIATASA